MLTKCIECQFYVRQTDEFCLNCGLQKPALLFEDEKFNLKRFALILGAMFVAALFIAFSASQGGTFEVSYIFICLFFSAILSVALEVVLGIYDAEKGFKNRKSANKDNFIEKGKIIQKRVSELINRGQKIDAVLGKIKDGDSAQLQAVRAKLFGAREIVVSQFARYELQAKKIELVRLQNAVAPYLFGFERLDESQTENGLAAIETAKAETNQIRQNLTRYDAIEFSKTVLPEKENFLAQIAETNQSLEKLREALLSRQAARALQEISPIEEGLQLPAARSLAHAAETFNIQTTLTDFSDSFDELEREYRRLRAENEVEIPES